MEKTIHFLNLNNYIDRDPLCEWTLASWEQNKPKDYNIKIWTEEDILVQEALKRKYCQLAKEKQMWTSIFEYVKAYILYNNGGVFVELDQVLFDEIPSDVVALNEFWSGGMPTTSFGPVKLAKNSEVAKCILSYFDYLSEKDEVQVSEFPCCFDGDFERLLNKATIIDTLPVAHFFDWPFIVKKDNLACISDSLSNVDFPNYSKQVFKIESIYHLPVTKAFVSNLLLLEKRTSSKVQLNGDFQFYDIDNLDENSWVQTPKYNGEIIHAKN